MKKIIIPFLLLVISISAKADEGMWLPQLLGQLNESRMKSLGMKISAKDIYDVNNGSLKDAIVSFGGFCTGEVISDKGLVLTNHHCGFDAIQNHSTLEHNYIRDGFWARSNAEELPNKGLFVTFIKKIDDVTAQALQGVSKDMSEADRQAVINKNMEILVNVGNPQKPHEKYFARAFFEGNKYYLFTTETFNDIRLVGAPPSSIGNFGKDSDNWMWPRHTGDFSMFRIYANKNNEPANYSPDNVPYIPKKSLSISMKGVKKDDFTMVFGFPGKTNEYLPSEAVHQTATIYDPAKILVRDKALAVLDGYMRSDESIKIQYASKYASISNAWKKWQGEVLGLTRTNAVAKKQAYEAEFQKRVDNDQALKSKYGTVLQDLNKAYEAIKPYTLARDYFTELMSKIELFTLQNRLRGVQLAKEGKGRESYSDALNKQVKDLPDFYKEFNTKVDKDVFAAMLQLYIEKMPAAYQTPVVLQQFEANGKDYKKWAEKLYASPLVNGTEVVASLGNHPEAVFEQLNSDEAAKLNFEMSTFYNEKVAAKLNAIQAQINQLQRTYMQAQMDVFKEKKFYPDANSTLRVTYGQVNGYEAADAKKYDFYTYLDGVMEKYIPGDYEFDVSEKLRSLYKNKDYGQYGTNGKMPVCFIASNHTTGGNSGSPALNANGHLIGLNFDRVWEGTMSDINYDPSICRNIMVDIRYILFVVDKFAGAGHLVKEMKLVH